jgi:hypothetical protein
VRSSGAPLQLRRADLQPTDREGATPSAIVYAVVDDAISPDFPLGVEQCSLRRRAKLLAKLLPT